MTLGKPLRAALGDKRGEFCIPGQADSFLGGQEGRGQGTAHLFLFWAQIQKTGCLGCKSPLPGALHLPGSALSLGSGTPKNDPLLGADGSVVQRVLRRSLCDSLELRPWSMSSLSSFQHGVFQNRNVHERKKKHRVFLRVQFYKRHLGWRIMLLNKHLDLWCAAVPLRVLAPSLAVFGFFSLLSLS